MLRAVAAAAVVAHHAYRQADADGALRIGAAGVDLFFVISGFIMATIGPGKRPGAFFADRAWRIFPLWLVALVPWLIIRRPGLVATLSSVTLWPIYGNAFHMPALGVGWTLSFEVLFYAAFTLALATRAWLPLLVFIGCAAAAVAADNALLSFLGSPLVAEFLFGVAVARLPLVERLGLPLVVVAAIAFAAAPLGFYDAAMGSGAWPRVLHWGVPAAALLYGALCLERHFDRPAFAPAVMLGNASYSIYLFHSLIIYGVTIAWPLRFVLAIATGVVLHFVIERPLQRRRKAFAWRYISDMRRRPAVGTVTASSQAPTSTTDASSVSV